MTDLTMKEKLRPVDLPDKHLRLVGLVITEWARLETVIDLGFSAYLGVSQRTGRALTSEIQTRSRLPLLKAIGKERLPKARFAELKTILDDASHYLTERNELAHAVWGVPDPGESPYLSIGEITKRGRFNTKSKEFRVPAMRKNAQNIRQITERLLAFLDETIEAPPA